MVFNKNMNEGMKRAIRDRLSMILKEEEKSFAHWGDNIRHKLNRTRQAQVERRFHKEIQAFKIVIHKLTPYMDRTEDEPSIVVKKPKPKKEIKGLLPPSSKNPDHFPGQPAPGLNADQISLLANLADMLKVKK